MKAIQSLIMAATVGLLIGIPQLTSSQRVTDSSDILKKPIGGVQLSNSTTPDILAQALINAGVPGGIAVRSSCGRFENRFLSPTNSTLRALLDAVVSVDPEYSWNVAEGVVNFVPRDNESVFLRSIVSKLEVHEVEPKEALERLLALPEVHKVARLELGPRTVTGGPYAFAPDGSMPEKKKVSLKLTNVTVREALNAIAREHGSAVWVLVTQEVCGPSNGYKSFNLRFISLL